MSKKFTIDQKKALKQKIDDVIKSKQGKKHSEKISYVIYKIIKECNPKIEVTSNSSGALLFFHNLSDNTYIKLDEYLNSLDKEELKRIKNTITRNSEILNTEMMTSENYTETLEDSRFKLSNKEKNIIKRKEYEKELEGSEHSDDNIYNTEKQSSGSKDNNIFIKKNKQNKN